MLNLRFRQTVSLCGMLLISLMLQAQFKGRETRTMVLPIDDIDCTDSETSCTIWVSLLELGVAPKGAQVTIRSTYSEENKTPKDIYTTTLEQAAPADIELTLPSEKGKQITVGDALVVDVSCPTMGSRGIISELSDRGIIFTTVGGEPFYYQASAPYMDSPTYERAMIDTMAADIRYTAREMRSQMEPYPLMGGIFDGMDLLDAMEKTHPGHVRDFLSYVAMRPNLYTGRRWKVSETYATWLAEQTPMPAAALADKFRMMIHGNEVEPLLEEEVKNLSPMEQREIVTHLLRQAKRENLLEPDAALLTNSKAWRIAEASGSKELVALTELSIGQLCLEDTTQAVSPVKDVEHAAAAFDKMGRIGMAARAYVVLAGLHNEAGDHKAALKAVRKSQSLNDEWGSMSYEMVEDADMLRAIAWRESGVAKAALKMYEDAQGDFWTALDVYSTLNNVEALLGTADCYEQLANICKTESDKECENEYRQEQKKAFWRAAEKARVFDAPK
jgi:tetratricopeptide (TPR) repeat protein